MNKRRRTSSIANRVLDEDEESHQSEPSRKRKRLDPVEIIQNLYDTIRNHKKDDGSLLCDSFIRAPKRRQEPAYYEVVSNPIDLLKVQQKIKTDEYEDVDDLTADIELLVSNAKAFYKRSSSEHKDAAELWELFQSTKSKLMDNSKCQEETNEPKGKIILKVGKLARRAAAAESKQKIDENSRGSIEKETSKDRLKDKNERDHRDKEREEKDEKEANELTHEEELNLCEDLFTAIMTATDNDGRPLHRVFQLLPSKKLYPKYYEVIEHPIDLRTIAKNIQASKYKSLNDIEKDLLIMTKNACLFNEPGSQIYKDAKTLKKIITSKKIEIEHGKYAASKSSERIRNKRLRGGQSMSAITAAIQDDSDDFELEEQEEDDEEDEDEGNSLESDEPDNPRWQLFLAVKNATSPQGALLSEPFWKLPSKRYYPDYYREIKKAISLMQIGRKLKKGDYGTVSEVASDLNLMFQNAKKYNRPDSRLYKDAAKLQKVMQSKVQELLEVDHQYSGESEDDQEDVIDEQRPKKLTTTTHRCLTRGKYLHNLPLKRRLYELCKCLVDYVCEDGRQPMLMFMEKPSKKLYPDYYEVITNPIDMLTIEANIKSEKYASEEEILSDFKLMFNNCRQYNEESSMIYEDAIRLEKILMDKVKELGPLVEQLSKTVNTTPTVNIKKISKANSGGTPRMLNKIKRIGTPNSIGNVNNLHPSSPMYKMKTLFTTLRDYKDPKGRQLSLIFMKLPSKTDYPDYYEIIKKPINLEQISHKLKVSQYDGLDDLVSDFVLMFDNACKYNEPDSQIYKDALMLQKLCLQTKLQLREDEDSVPDVPAAVHELLTSLFTIVYNHQDDESRCFSDSMAELPEHDDVNGKKVRALSLDLIKRRLDGNQYQRLDLFQEDIFSCLERARRLTSPDSQVFEDSVELQSYFIRQRDELCKNGDLLHSPALNFTLMDLSNTIEEMRKSKMVQEQPEEEAETRSSEDTNRDESSSLSSAGTADNAFSYNQQVYRIGDFVYAEAKERGMEPILLNIQRLWTNSDGQQMLYGNQFYRPRETYHVTTRKFLEKEVFKTDQNVAIPLNKVLGRCCVLSVKDYFRCKPEGFEDKDVYVCESRYSSRARAFKKIKSWPPNLANGYKLMPRDKVLEPIRNMSVFRERVEKHKEEIAELEEQEKLIIKEKPNVILDGLSNEDRIFYEQYSCNSIVIKTGDFVYLQNDNGNIRSSINSINNTSGTNSLNSFINKKNHPLIQQIDKIWTNKDGEAFIRGPWMVLASDIRLNPPRLFYKQEIFLSTQEDTSPVTKIIGKCAVLEHSEYISCRPTEVPEKDIYLCESLYDSSSKCMRELPRDGLKKYVHSPAVTQDEIYFFRRLINPPKVGGDPSILYPSHHQQQILHQYPHQQMQHIPLQQHNHISKQLFMSHQHQLQGHLNPNIQPYDVNTGSIGSPLVPKLEPDVVLEDSLDGNASLSDRESIGTPVSSRKSKNTGKKLVTGYILYSGDIRRQVVTNNPDRNFGEISRIVGNEWRKLPPNEKMAYEEKAARMNEENAAAKLEAAALIELNRTNSPGPPQDLVYECCWDNCDYQFEDIADCVDHAVAEGNGHVQQYFAAVPPSELEFQCQWRTCMRMKKPCAPFPSLNRLTRHVKEVHILKNTGKHINSDQRSKNYVPARRPLPMKSPLAQHMHGGLHHATVASGLMNQARSTPSPHSQNGGAVGKPLEPLFVTVPPRPQRLLHSDTYIKYIENLNSESRNISNWDRQLKANQQNIEPPTDQSRLPANWLANGVGNHDNLVNALWTLRDFMFRDALGLSKLM